VGKFTTCDFNTDIFDRHLSHLKGGYCLFLEIGTFEGRSTEYLLKNWPESVVITIDPCTPYPIPGYEDYIAEDQETTIRQNLYSYLRDRRCEFRCDYSRNVLPQLHANEYDCIFIDGDHRMQSVYNDSVMSWPLLKVGGIMIFDDYNWLPKGYNGPFNNNCPHLGIDKFLAETPNHTVLQKDYVVAVRKEA